MFRSAVVECLPGLDGHSAIAFGIYLVVYGGKTHATSVSDQVFALELPDDASLGMGTTPPIGGSVGARQPRESSSAGLWRRLRCAGAQPAGRAYHSAVLWAQRQRMIVFGGLLAVGVDDIHYNAYNVMAHPDALDESALRSAGATRRRDPSTLRRVTQQRQEACYVHALDLSLEQPTWTAVVTAGTVPPTRSHHNSTVYRSTMYVTGGYSVHTTGRLTDEEVKALSLVYALDLDSHVWSVIDAAGSVAPQRWGSAAILSGDIWLFFGGVLYTAEAAPTANSRRQLQTGGTGQVTACGIEDNAVCAWSFVTNEWRWLPLGVDSPPSRAGHTAVRWGGDMVCFGGFTNIGTILLNDVTALDVDRGTWSDWSKGVSTNNNGAIAGGLTEVACLPRSGHSATVIGNAMFVFGGVDYSFQRASRVWCLNLRSHEWATVSTSFSSRDLTNLRGVPAAASRKVTILDTTGHSDWQRVAQAAAALSGDPRMSNNDASPSHRSYAAAIGTFTEDAGGSPVRRFHAEDLDRTYKYPTSYAPDEVQRQNSREADLRAARRQVASTRTVLDNTVTAASDFNQRYLDEFDQHAPRGAGHAGDSAGGSVVDGIARDRLITEIGTRTQRLRELADTGNDKVLHDTASAYWRNAIQDLSGENLRWRQSVQDEHAALERYEMSVLDERDLRNGTRRSMDAVRHGMDLGRSSASSSSLPPPSATSAGRKTTVITSQHGGVSTSAVPSRQYVSPILVKLGVAGQLKRRPTGPTAEELLNGGPLPIAQAGTPAAGLTAASQSFHSPSPYIPPSLVQRAESASTLSSGDGTGSYWGGTLPSAPPPALEGYRPSATSMLRQL